MSLLCIFMDENYILTRHQTTPSQKKQQGKLYRYHQSQSSETRLTCSVVCIEVLCCAHKNRDTLHICDGIGY